MDATKWKVTITFTETVLGTTPKSKDVLIDYIQSQARDNGVDVEDELETVQDMTEKCWTGFHEVDGQPIVYDYMVKGFLKDAARMLNRVSDSRTAKLKAFVKVIDGLVFIEPRRIPLVLPAGEKIGILDRPLRAQTPQGERVALTRSDTAPVGTRLEFGVTVLGTSVNEAMLREWFDYGQYRGMLQWRNGGFGRFTYTLEAA